MWSRGCSGRGHQRRRGRSSRSDTFPCRRPARRPRRLALLRRRIAVHVDPEQLAPSQTPRPLVNVFQLFDFVPIEQDRIADNGTPRTRYGARSNGNERLRHFQGLPDERRSVWLRQSRGQGVQLALFPIGQNLLVAGDLLKRTGKSACSSSQSAIVSAMPFGSLMAGQKLSVRLLYDVVFADRADYLLAFAARVSGDHDEVVRPRGDSLPFFEAHRDSSVAELGGALAQERQMRPVVDLVQLRGRAGACFVSGTASGFPLDGCPLDVMPPKVPRATA